MGRGKHTMQDALNSLPEPTPQCPVARVLGPRGQNLHEIVVARSVVADDINKLLNPENKPWFTTLAQLPPKYRSVVWVKRGGYVMVDLTEQLTDKIGGDIALVLMPRQIKNLKQIGQWPEEYEAIWNALVGTPSSSNRPGSAAADGAERSADSPSSDTETDSDSSSSSSSSDDGDSDAK